MLFVKRRLILVGAGGQGRAVAEAARAARFRVLGFLDDEKQGKYILGSTAEAGRFARRAGFLLCVGDNAGRRALAKALGQTKKLLTERWKLTRASADLVLERVNRYDTVCNRTKEWLKEIAK